MLELPVALLKKLNTLTVADSTAGDTALSIQTNTYLALDGTLTGANTPTYGLRYNNNAPGLSGTNAIDFQVGANEIFRIKSTTGATARCRLFAYSGTDTNVAFSIDPQGSGNVCVQPLIYLALDGSTTVRPGGGIRWNSTGGGIEIYGAGGGSPTRILSAFDNTPTEKWYLDQAGNQNTVSLTTTDSTSGHTVLSIAASTFLAFDGTAVGANTPGYAIQKVSGGSLNLTAAQANSGTNIAFVMNNTVGLSGNTELLSIQNNGVEKFNVTQNGTLTSSGNLTFTGSNSNATISTNVSNAQITIQGNQGDGSGVIGVKIDNANTLNNVGAKAILLANGGTEYAAFMGRGQLNWKTNQYTDNSGTPGATTINKVTGRAAIANGASSVVVTNNLVTATSIVLVTLETSAAGIGGLVVVPGVGSFTVTSVNGTGVATNTTAAVTFSFIVFNA